MRYRTPSLLLATISLATALVACGPAAPPTSPSQPSPINTPQPTITTTPLPTRTPGPPVTLAIIPPDLDASLAQEAQARFGDLAQSAGMLFQTQPELQTAELPPDLATLIVLTPVSSADVAAIRSRAPDARIVALAAEGLDPQPNLTLLQAPDDAELQQAFLAGYTAALITDDYRVATLISSSPEEASTWTDAFRNGAEYYCGLCRPERPPFEDYPLTLPFDAKNDAVASTLAGTGVQTVFVPATLSSAQALADMVDSGLTLLGTVPPPAEYKKNWAASFQPSAVAVIEAAWQSITSTSPPDVLTMPITVGDVNPDLLSPGRLRLVVRTQTDLGLGLIDVTSSQ